jgi:hypothetical protein
MPKALLTSLTAALFAFALFASSAEAAPAEYAGSSGDGSKVFFTTKAKLVPGDTDNGFEDVYERFYDGAPGIETYVTREISTGPTGGNDSYDVTFGGVSDNGEKVFFSTAESLVAADKDKSRDVYERNTATGETILLSGGPASCAPCGNRETPATFVGATPTGSKVFFTTDERLTENDTDEAGDVYVRDPSEAAAVLATPGGAAPVTFQGASADGTKVVFETAEKLDLSDTDEEADVYERDISAGTTKLVSGGACPLPPAECIPLYRATAADGSVLLQTKAQLSPEDKDTFQDVYDWSPASGAATLVSTGAEGEEGAGPHNAEFAGIAASGSKVFFETDESLSALDGDGANDVYERSSGSTTLISGGSAALPAFFNGSSADGSTVIFSTREALGGGDSGEKLDGYERSGGTLTLLTPGSAEFDATVVGHSSDASDVFYTTAQKLAAADTDSNPDIYEWSGGGAPVLISTGPAGGNGSFTPHFAGASDDASHVFFTTQERLTVDDNFAAESDVYERSAGGTLLVSTGNSGELQLGPSAPGLTTTDPLSPNVSTEPNVLGEAEVGTSIKIYPTPDCSGAPAGIGTAAELNAGGIKVTVKADSTTTFHATATNTSGDTSACSSRSVTYVQESAVLPPPEEPPAGGGGGGGGSGGGSGSPVGGGSPGAGTGSGGSTSGSGSSGAIKIGGIVYVAPLVRITVGPASKTRSRRPVFQFVDTVEQPNTQFFCKIDRKPWKRCTSPYRPKALNLGKHLFSVKGRSAAGQWGARPVMRRFKVVGR